MYTITWHFFITIFLTALTQIGGLIWLLTLFLVQRFSFFFLPRFIFRCMLFGILYSFATVVLVPPLARKYSNRVPLPVRRNGVLQPKSIFSCFFNRHYIKRPLLREIKQVAAKINLQFPNTITYYLDVSFPFSNNFPLFPHMGHRRGTCIDLSYYYVDKNSGQSISPPSPFGYWIYEAPRSGEIKPPKNLPRLNLRWNFSWLQPKKPSFRVDDAKMHTIIQQLTATPSVHKLLIERHLKNRWAPENPLVRFQGYRSARHDDHLHVRFHG